MCDCNDGCPQVGVGGVHSDSYYETDGQCNWCAAAHHNNCELLENEPTAFSRLIEQFQWDYIDLFAAASRFIYFREPRNYPAEARLADLSIGIAMIEALN